MKLRAGLALLTSASFFAFSQSPTFSDVYRDFQSAVESEQMDEALRLAEQAQALGEDKFGKNSEQARMLAFTYANMQIINGHTAGGLNGYEDIEAYYRRTYGESSLQYMEMLLIFVETLRDNIDFHETSERNRMQLYLRDLLRGLPAIDAEQKALAPLYARTSTLIARANTIPVRGESLVEFMDKALTIVSAEYGQGDLRTVETLYANGLAKQADRRREEAIAHFGRVIAVLKDKNAFTHPYALSAHAKLVSLYESNGVSGKATEHCLAIGKMTPWDPEQEATPLYRQPPEFPAFAARNRQEGSARLRFDIDAQGFVKNIEVVEVTGSSQFGHAAETALAHWRYAPRFEKGQAVVATGNEVKLEFNLE